MDYYQILGINENASQDEIKQAYKKLAMKNHPDRGGDTKTFQSISQAYDTLGDEQKRQQYDAQRHGFGAFNNQGNPAGFGPGAPFGDVFSQFGFHFGNGFAQPQTRRNRDLTIRVSITLKQSYTGTQIEAKFNTPAGRSQTVVVDVPAGVMSGQTIRYADLGDDSIPQLPRGNLNVNVIVEPDPNWERRGNDLFTTLTISALEAMTGCMKEVMCLDGSAMPLKIRPGIRHGAEFASGGRGFRDINTGRVGSIIVVLEIDMPAVLDHQMVQELHALYAKLR